MQIDRRLVRFGLVPIAAGGVMIAVRYRCDTWIGQVPGVWLAGPR